MKVEAEAVAAYLREVAEDVTALRRHLRPGNNPGEVWQQAFAERLGYCWRDLTGSNPSATSDEFIDFLHAAFSSLGGGERALIWKGPVKTAVARVIGKKVRGKDERVGGQPAWDQFDRLEWGARPPGGTMNVRPLSEYEARQEWRQRRFVGHVLDWIDAPTEEARRTAHLVLLTEWSYAPDDEKNREQVRRIVANRDAGGNDIWAGSLRTYHGTLPR